MAPTSTIASVVAIVVTGRLIAYELRDMEPVVGVAIALPRSHCEGAKRPKQSSQGTLETKQDCFANARNYSVLPFRAYRTSESLRGSGATAAIFSRRDGTKAD